MPELNKFLLLDDFKFGGDIGEVLSLDNGEVDEVKVEVDVLFLLRFMLEGLGE